MLPSLRRSRMLCALGSLALVALLAGAARPARADLPPPDGTRFVSYGYAVDGLEAHPDYVLLGYPSSASNGRPMDDYAELGASPTSLGRRGGSPVIYAVKKGDYEAWKASLAPLGPDAPTFDNPVFKAFFSSAEAVRCDEAPKPQFTLPSSDPREAIVERFRVVALSAEACDLERVSDGRVPASTDGFASPPDAEGAGADESRSMRAAPPPGRGGCFCAVLGPTGDAEAPLAAAALLLGTLVAGWARRARRRDRS